MAITVYGTNLCPATLQALAIFTEHHVMPDFINVTGSIGLMKEYTKIRETDPAFRDLWGSGQLYFPFFRLEDGTITLSAKEAFRSVGIDADLEYK